MKSRRIDLTGKRYGRLVVLGYSHCKKHNAGSISHYWECVCDCGKKKTISASCLTKRHGSTTSCGCYQKERVREDQLIDLTGKRFGRLVVLGYSHCKKYNNRSVDHYWHCLCDCGKKKAIGGAALRRGDTTSCGCYQKKRVHDRLIDLTGKKFGLLTVVEYSHKHKIEHYWKCKCECGGESTVAGVSLRHGGSNSCGCRQGNYTHGLTANPREYKKYLRQDPVRKLRHNVGTHVRYAMKSRGLTKGGRTFAHLPYTPLELKEHLESQFESWMNWDNYGGRTNRKDRSWQIDHIKPQALFVFTSLKDEAFRQCWALDNLRPLEKIANMKKGVRLV